MAFLRKYEAILRFLLLTICANDRKHYFCAPFNNKAMAVTRFKRKARKDKSKASVRRQSLKNQNFQPVAKSVDIEKIKEEFKAKAAAKKNS